MKKIYSAALLCVCYFCVSPVVHTAPTEHFSDIQGHKYQQHIEYLHHIGLVEGYADNTFRPDQTINRAEFLKIFLVSIFNENVFEECLQNELMTFSDVRPDSWFAPYVCVGKKYGHIDGYPDRTFRSGHTVNYAEVAKILSVWVSPSNFAVQEGQEWWEPYTETLTKYGNGL